MSSNELVILFGISYEAIFGLLAGVVLVVFSVGFTAALILVLFALCRRFFKRGRGFRSGNERAEHNFVFEWLK
ncbi:hypothetical protein [Streptosporangium jomthongense]|uniref:Uncharacterized protein n=1 Tax=Streptosporangium jomthongense TaxID=1193683 RepID=A0ABV8F701_9ACTN